MLLFSKQLHTQLAAQDFYNKDIFMASFVVPEIKDVVFTSHCKCTRATNPYTSQYNDMQSIGYGQGIF